MQTAADIQKKALFKIRLAKKYAELFIELRYAFVSARDKGHRVDFNWLLSKARNIFRQQQGDDEAVLKKHVVANFIKRHSLKLRRVQRNKKHTKEHFRAPLLKWHATLRERLIRTGAGQPGYDNQWGRFLPSRRLNVDQSPLPFAIDTRTTYELVNKKDTENRNKKVWCAQPKSADSKRFCSLNVCFSPEGKQPRLAIIFRGQGKRLSDVEKNSWDKDVDVYF